MNKRFITGLAVGLASLFAVLAGGLWLAIALGILVILLSREYTEILKHKGFLPSFKIMITSSILFGLVVYFKAFDFVPIVLIVTVLASLMWVLFRGKQPYIANVATTIFGALYCGWFPLYLLMLRQVGETSTGDGIPYPIGASYCILILFTVSVTDIFCYFVGCKFGKHKLAPVISPNKTIEGSLGGTIMCLLFSILIGMPLGLTWYHAIILGILIAAFAQIGDLCESMIKRDAGVKDSSNILPGHGGLLDRADSYIFTAAVTYYFLYYFQIPDLYIFALQTNSQMIGLFLVLEKS